MIIDLFDGLGGLPCVLIDLGDHLLSEFLHVLALILNLFEVEFGTFVADND